MGTQISGYILSGVASAGGSMVGDLAHDYLLNHIPNNQKYSNVESTLLAIGASEAFNSILLSPTEANPTIMFGLGSASYIITDYALMNYYGTENGMLMF